MIPCKRLTKTAKIPVLSSVSGAAYELYADHPDAATWHHVIMPGQTRNIRTGISIELGLELNERSYPGGKEQSFSPCPRRCALIIPRYNTSPFIIGADFTEEIKVPASNFLVEGQLWIPNEGVIAQMLILPYFNPGFGEVQE